MKALCDRHGEWLFLEGQREGRGLQLKGEESGSRPLISDVNVFGPFLPFAGQHAGPAVGCRGLRGVLFQGVGKQCAGCFPRHHVSIRQPDSQTPQAQQLKARAEAGLADAGTDRLVERL